MDRFYRRILQALEGHLDPEVFQDCVCDLLRDAFPGLVPVRGGADGGMDGAIADGEGEAYPLVCTTRQDVIGNLTESLDSYLRRGGSRRKVVLATSQALTPMRRRNLEERGREKGFTLVQIVDREGIARRLRWSPEWYRELGIPWTPSALSTVPKTRRPLLEIELVGREADLEWLRTTSGDRILSGQPGSGKTFLLYQLVREGWGLFLVDDNRQALAQALAHERPSVVVVDDAHADLRLLDQLRQLRDEVGHRFDIVATTWDGERERVAEAMGGLAPSQMRRLELLTRKEILEIYHRAGVKGSYDVMRHLVDQAANKPGLAVTLATIVLRGGPQNLGEVLRRTVTNIFRDLIGEEAEDILASFALGGDRGMTMAAVAEFLSMDVAALRRTVVGLAAGGVLSEAAGDALAVWPRTLRPSLLHAVFFRRSGTDLDYRPLLKKAPSPISAVETLVLAARYGVPVPAPDLRQLVVREGSVRAWTNLTAINEEWARWALNHYPGDVEDLAPEALDQVPEQVIPRLLERAVGVSGPLPSQPRHPLRILSDWIQEARVSQEAIRRRRLVVRAARRFLESGGEGNVAVHALCLALSPEWRTIEDDALGQAVNIRQGLLDSEALEQISGLWTEVRESLAELNAATWQHIRSTLWSWIAPPGATSGKAPERTIQILRTLAATALQDLAPLATGSPGLAVGLRDLANRIGVDLALEEDPVFELLYLSADETREERLQGNSDPDKALRSLAREWAKLRPQETAERLARYENEARKIDRTWWPRRVEFGRYLAEYVSQPEPWLEAFIDQDLAGDLVLPLLEAVARRTPPGWEATVSRCFDEEHLTGAATVLVLHLPAPPPRLLRRALEAAVGFPGVVETMCLRGEVPVSTLRELLKEGEVQVAAAAAVGEWGSEPEGRVRPQVASEWRGAILRARVNTEEGSRNTGIDYWLGKILGRDSVLALEWILRRLQEGPLRSFLEDDDPLAKAIGVLDADQRREVLQALPATPWARDLVTRLVAKDPDLYRQFLRLDHLRGHHLAPLAGMPDERWAEMAWMALDKGYSPDEIAHAAFSGLDTYGWPGLDYWSRWEDAFRQLEEGDPRPEIRDVARQGRALAEGELRQARDEERQARLHGIIG